MRAGNSDTEVALWQQNLLTCLARAPSKSARPPRSPARSSAALLENAAFFGAQMSAMDSATRNAGDMIDKLTMRYNRARQANITKELIEIISGAEAL